MTDLAARRCRPLAAHEGLSEGDPALHVALLPGWSLRADALEQRLGFADRDRTMALVNAPAWVAQVEGHPSDAALDVGQGTVRRPAHPAGGISIIHFICAAKIDALRP